MKPNPVQQLMDERESKQAGLALIEAFAAACRGLAL
jgi:hypothetical protein